VELGGLGRNEGNAVYMCRQSRSEKGDAGFGKGQTRRSGLERLKFRAESSIGSTVVFAASHAAARG
jgi:hypothetical protein